MEKFGDLLKLSYEHVFTPLRPWNVLTGRHGLNIFVEGKGRRLTDMNGKTYLDLWGTVQGANLVGWGRKEIADAAYEQMLKLHMTPTYESSIPK